MKVSSLKREGIAELWETMSEFRSIMLKSGELEAVRERQQVVWMRNQIRANLLQLFQMHPGVRARIEKMENMVAKSAMTPGFAADILLQEFTKSLAQNSL
jgi:LAO/AO transport system kinase